MVLRAAMARADGVRSADNSACAQMQHLCNSIGRQLQAVCNVDKTPAFTAKAVVCCGLRRKNLSLAAHNIKMKKEMNNLPCNSAAVTQGYTCKSGTYFTANSSVDVNQQCPDRCPSNPQVLLLLPAVFPLPPSGSGTARKK